MRTISTETYRKAIQRLRGHEAKEAAAWKEARQQAWALTMDENAPYHPAPGDAAIDPADMPAARSTLRWWRKARRLRAWLNGCTFPGDPLTWLA